MSNVRNSRTTFPRKQARQQRALARFTIKPDGNKEYLARKEQELLSLKKTGY